jgi:hypothetical protein
MVPWDQWQALLGAGTENVRFIERTVFHRDSPPIGPSKSTLHFPELHMAHCIFQPGLAVRSVVCTRIFRFKALKSESSIAFTAPGIEVPAATYR